MFNNLAKTEGEKGLAPKLSTEVPLDPLAIKPDKELFAADPLNNETGGDGLTQGQISRRFRSLPK